MLRNAREQYTKMCDIYSLAMCVWEVYAGVPPFEDLGHFEIQKQVVAGARPALPVAEIPASEQQHDSRCCFEMEAEMVKLIQQSWEDDPLVRPTIDEWQACAEKNFARTVGKQGGLAGRTPTNSKFSTTGSVANSSNRSNRSSAGDISAPLPQLQQSLPSLSLAVVARSPSCQ